MEPQAVLSDDLNVKSETLKPPTKGVGKMPDPKPYDLKEMHVSQRSTLKDGLKGAMMESKEWWVMGSQHKILFYSTCDMMGRPESLRMLNIKGEDYWKKIDVPGSKKKESVRFLKFTFDFVIPGTNSSLTAVKEWRYEDFR